MPDLLEPISWVVHPLGGMTLAFLASVIFSRRGRRSPRLLGALVLLLALSVLGAGWLAHPAAGLTLALLASVMFRAWRRERVTIVAALIALAVFSVLGAEWAIYPLLGLGLAWLMKVVATGELFRAAPRLGRQEELERRPASAQPFAGSPAALPVRGGGEALPLLGFPERVAARIERRLLRRTAKLERKAERLGVPFRVQAAPVAPPVAPVGDLLALSRDERLPADARARLGALHFRCQESSAYLKDREQDAAGAGFMLRQIAEDYAPEAVRAYLKLPPSLANVTPLQDGKTGRDLLGEQLDLLLGAVQDIMRDAAQAGSQHLLAHQRFLKDRFAKPSDELKL